MNLKFEHWNPRELDIVPAAFSPEYLNASTWWTQQAAVVIREYRPAPPLQLAGVIGDLAPHSWPDVALIMENMEMALSGTSPDAEKVRLLKPMLHALVNVKDWVYTRKC